MGSVGGCNAITVSGKGGDSVITLSQEIQAVSNIPSGETPTQQISESVTINVT